MKPLLALAAAFLGALALIFLYALLSGASPNAVIHDVCAMVADVVRAVAR